MPAGDRPVVVDSTPIIALSLAGRLDLLRAFYRQVVIPPAVRPLVETLQESGIYLGARLVGKALRLAGE
jgi:predicted nucleic acid-binding protein